MQNMLGAAAHAVRKKYSRTRKLPNTFIAGAQKSGTTSLHRILEAHPAVYFPHYPQEIHFFDWQGEPVIAQTSPLYLYEQAVPARIKQSLPESRFVFILRHPVERAYSHYWHEVRYGYEPLSFEEAIACEPERLAAGNEARQHYSYLDRGRYAQQIARYYAAFSANQILVLLYDELQSDFTGLCSRSAQFLEIAQDGWDLLPVSLHHHNRTKLPRSRTLQQLRPSLARRSLLLAEFLDRLNLTDARYPPLSEDTCRRLQREFSADISAVADLTKRDVHPWLTR